MGGRYSSLNLSNWVPHSGIFCAGVGFSFVGRELRLILKSPSGQTQPEWGTHVEVSWCVSDLKLVWLFG